MVRERSRPALLSGPGAQRVHQPRLAPRLRPHRIQRRRREPLASLLRVLRHQGAGLRFGEVAHAKRLRRDVERAAAGDDLAGARPDAVVADVAHPAQHHALREASGTLLVAGTELAQHREQGVTDQRVDLVHQQHQRHRVRHAPAGEHLPQGVVGARPGERVRPDTFQGVVAEQLGAHGQAAQDGAHALRHVVARHLGDLHVHVHAAEVAGLSAVEQVTQGDEGGGLAGLARRVQHEVLLGPNQGKEFIHVHAVQGRDGVVVVRAYRSCGVEEVHGPIIAFATHCRAHVAEPYAQRRYFRMRRGGPYDGRVPGEAAAVRGVGVPGGVGGGAESSDGEPTEAPARGAGDPRAGRRRVPGVAGESGISGLGCGGEADACPCSTGIGPTRS